MEAREFYDRYVDRQTAVGINDRHRAILGWLTRFGLRSGQRVLEIGCGVGTVTELLAETLGSDALVVGIDLSPGMTSFTWIPQPSPSILARARHRAGRLLRSNR